MSEIENEVVEQKEVVQEEVAQEGDAPEPTGDVASEEPTEDPAPYETNLQ
jgi:hypothetical protein